MDSAGPGPGHLVFPGGHQWRFRLRSGWVEPEGAVRGDSGTTVQNPGPGQCGEQWPGCLVLAGALEGSACSGKGRKTGQKKRDWIKAPHPTDHPPVPSAPGPEKPSRLHSLEPDCRQGSACWQGAERPVAALPWSPAPGRSGATWPLMTDPEELEMPSLVAQDHCLGRTIQTQGGLFRLWKPTPKYTHTPKRNPFALPVTSLSNLIPLPRYSKETFLWNPPTPPS